MAKIKYYSIKNLLNKIPNARYYIIYSPRRNGKTYSMLKGYFKNGKN